MVIVQVCVGSSCHLKGAPEIIEMLQREVEKNGIGDEVVLSGSFCTGKCNRFGVTISVGDEVYTGITRETFLDFFREKILSAVISERG